MHSDLPWEIWSRERQRRIEEVLARALTLPDVPLRLADAMRYAVLGGGKRVRPLLAYAAGEATGADPAVVDDCAAAVELVHAYSLVHDDLPCMDDDTLRRGKPTVHVAFDYATALLAGDALQARAFELLGASAHNGAGTRCALLARAAGAFGMAGGQAIDLASTGTTLARDALDDMHRMKTGALIHAAIRLGAQCGRPLAADEVAAFDAYAASAGLAFQIVDDLLDAEGSVASIGKTAGKDAANGKPTYVTMLGADSARTRLESLRAEAQAALTRFGGAGRRLNELADWIVLRRH